MSKYIFPILESFPNTLAIILNTILVIIAFLISLLGLSVIIYILIRITKLKDPIKYPSEYKHSIRNRYNEDGHVDPYLQI